MGDNFLKALREYIDEAAEKAKWDAIDCIRESDESNNYLKMNKAWEKVVYEYEKQKYDY